MKPTISTISVLLLLGHPSLAQQGQNLLFNGSFEERNVDLQGVPYCPQGPGVIEAAMGWYSLFNNADYLHTCSNTIYSGIPQNRGGYQMTKDGVAYISIGGYVPWGTNMREFVWIELPDALKAGYGYEFEGWVSLRDSMNFAMAGFGALFTNHDMWDWTSVIYTDSVLNQHPQVLNPYDNLLDDKENWMRVSGYFVAEGGEKFMTIGFFRRDEDDNIQRVSNHPEATYNWEGAGYYVDALALYEVSGVGLEGQSSIDNEQLTVWPNPSDQEFRATHTGRQGMLVLRELTGRVVAKTAASNESTVVSTLDVANGIYLLEFIADAGPKWHQRVVVRHR